MLKSENGDKPSTLGILGGGQLAKMLAQATYRVGLNVAIIEGHSGSPAGDMTKSDFSEGRDNSDELDRFIEISDRITLENEFINPEIIEYIESKGKPVYPSSKTMRLVQDKFIQKQTFADAGLPVPVFEKLDTPEQAEIFGKNHSFPFIVKSRKFGYDGYGNAKIDSPEDIASTFQKFGNDSKRSSLMGEEFVPFIKELAVMTARSEAGEIKVYPCVETIQENHICKYVTAPAEIDESIRKKAQEISVEAVKTINGIGVFGIELFLTEDTEILINEIAPRPHNSGHYTIEACHTSQFENALRAVYGLPLGSPEMRLPGAAMVNLLGTRDGIGIPDDPVSMLRHPEVALHLYNKKKCRIGRKMGHITALGNSPAEAFRKAEAAAIDFKW